MADNEFTFSERMGIRSSPESIVLGQISGSLLAKEELTEGQLNHHVHIVGASGFGKTVLITQIVKDRIAKGKGILFIDLKADMETLMELTKAVAVANRLDDLKVFSLTENKLSSSYNLVGNGSATQLRDRIMGSLTWTEEYYKNQSSSFLLKVCIILCWLRDHKNLSLHLGLILDCASSKEKFLALAKEIPLSETKIKNISQEVYAFLESKDNFSSLQGLRSQLESIALADFGDLIATGEGGINLFRAATKSEIVFVFLDSRRFGETAKSLGRFIIQDLKATAAKIDSEVPKAERRPFTVVIDEFADLAQEDFIGFLDRARSSRMSIVVAHQEICDLERISPEFAGRLMANTSTLYSFLQKRSESAEIIAGLAGTRSILKKTYQAESFFGIDVPTGARSLREVEEYRIHPNLVKTLRVGKCVCIKKYPKSRAYLIKVNPGISNRRSISEPQLEPIALEEYNVTYD